MNITKSILAVDDDAPIRAMYPLMLQQEGYRVVTARNGEEALRFLAEEEMHLVISDIRMPGMDGLELLRRVKERYRDTKVVMISEMEHDEEKIQMLGALQLLPKPLPKDQLVAAITRALFEERRTTCRFGTLFSFKTDLHQEGQTLNISSDGMLVQTGEPLPVNRDLLFTVRNPHTDRYFKVNGTVLKTAGVRDACHGAVYFAHNVGGNLAACMGSV